MTVVAIKDYFELTKPKVVALMMITLWVGMALAPAGNIEAYVWGSIGVAMAAGSAAAFNHLVEHQIDIKMRRTHNRPVATGRVPAKKALLFAFILGVFGIGLLFIFTNPLTAWLTLLSQGGYALFYTLFLKHATPQNIVIGGAFGAAPPLLGWVAVTGNISALPLLLMLIIFVWTPPHFWALAINRKDEYAKVAVPMLPVTHGVAFTQLSVLLYTILLVVVSILPWACQLAGLIYLFFALILGGRFLYMAVQLYSDARYSWPTFKYSISYLFLLFTGFLADHYLLLEFH